MRMLKLSARCVRASVVLQLTPGSDVKPSSSSVRADVREEPPHQRRRGAIAVVNEVRADLIGTLAVHCCGADAVQLLKTRCLIQLIYFSLILVHFSQ